MSLLENVNQMIYTKFLPLSDREPYYSISKVKTNWHGPIFRYIYIYIYIYVYIKEIFSYGQYYWRDKTSFSRKTLKF